MFIINATVSNIQFLIWNYYFKKCLKIAKLGYPLIINILKTVACFLSIRNTNYRYAILYSSQYVISSEHNKIYSNLMTWTCESLSETNLFLPKKWKIWKTFNTAVLSSIKFLPNLLMNTVTLWEWKYVLFRIK